MVSGTTAPVALAALIGLWTGAVNGVTVVDGPVFDATAAFLAVGWDREGQPAIQAAQPAIASLGAMRERESYSITHTLSMFLDQGTLADVRGTLFTAYTAYRARVLADRTLGGTVLATYTGAWSYTPVVTETGDWVDLQFATVHDAFIVN